MKFVYNVEQEKTGFNYQMGRLKEFDPVKNQAQRAIPAKSKHLNKVVNTATMLPEIKFIDPKPKEPSNKTTKKNNSKAQVTHAGTAKSANQIEKSHMYPIEATTQKSVPSTNTGDKTISVEELPRNNNPAILSEMIVYSNPQNNIAVANKPTPLGNSKISEEAWLSQMTQYPNIEMAKRFFAAYKNGDISQRSYFATIKNLIFDPIDSRKQVGLYLLSLEVSTQSFVTLFEITERDVSFQDSLNFILSGYLTEAGLIALLPLLNSNSNYRLISFTLRTIEKAISSGLLVNAKSQVPKITSNRGGHWRRIAVGAAFDVKSHLTLAIKQLIQSNDLPSETIELAQSIEQKLNNPRTVAAGS